MIGYVENAGKEILMLAYRLLEAQQPPQLIEAPKPKPGPGEVLLKVAGCGLCHTSSKDQDGKLLPGVAQVAMQGGKYATNVIMSRAKGVPPPKPFRYFDKGNLAVVGRGFAVLQSGLVTMSGLSAWFVWAFVHIQFLAQPGLRVSVLLQWVWTFLTDQRGSRLIVRKNATS